MDSWQSAVCGAFAGAKDYMLYWERLKKKEKCANLLSIAEQHSFVIQVCLEENGSSCCLEIGKSAKEREGEEKKTQTGCLFERQPICF